MFARLEQGSAGWAMDNTETVFVVDDDSAVREALTLFLESEGFRVEAYAAGRAFLDACQTERCGCAILDISMPEMDGLALQRALADRGIRIPIIFLTGQGTVPKAVRALKGGAVDFLEKPPATAELLDRVRTALAQDAARRKEDSRRMDLVQRLARLTPREQQIMTLVATGLSNKEIGRQLDISFRTVEGHRQRVAEKMQASSLAELVEMARICGLT